MLVLALLLTATPVQIQDGVGTVDTSARDTTGKFKVDLTVGSALTWATTASRKLNITHKLTREHWFVGRKTPKRVERLTMTFDYDDKRNKGQTYRAITRVYNALVQEVIQLKGLAYVSATSQLYSNNTFGVRLQQTHGVAVGVYVNSSTTVEANVGLAYRHQRYESAVTPSVSGVGPTARLDVSFRLFRLKGTSEAWRLSLRGDGMIPFRDGPDNLNVFARAELNAPLAQCCSISWSLQEDYLANVPPGKDKSFIVAGVNFTAAISKFYSRRRV